MKPKYIPRLLKVCMQANVVPMLIGEKGVGKSRVTEDFTKTEEIGFIDQRLGQREAQDLIGLPRDRENTNEKTKGILPRVTDFIPPRFIEVMHRFDKGIIFWDEANRAMPDTLQALFQGLLPSWDAELGKYVRRLDQHIFPEGWFPVVAGNPDTAEYMVQVVDTAFLDRVCQIAVTKDWEGVTAWLRKNVEDVDVANFVGTDEMTLGSKEAFNLVVKPSPRSWEFVGRITPFLTEEDYNTIALEIFQGLLGSEVGTAFYQYKKDNFLKPISIEEILNHTMTAEQFYERKMKKYMSGREIHTELLSITNDRIGDAIENNNNIPDTGYKNIAGYLRYLPADMVNKFVISTGKHPNFMKLAMHLKTDKELFMRLFKSLDFEEKDVLEGLAAIEKAVEEHLNSKPKKEGE